MDDLMLYIMVASILGMFGWAAFEYAKAGYQFWKEQRQASNASKTPGHDNPQSAQTIDEDVEAATTLESSESEQESATKSVTRDVSECC